MDTKKLSLFGQKVLSSIAPIAWGSLVWFMGWGIGNVIIQHYSLNYIMQVVVAVLVINYFFGSALQRAYKVQELTFFQFACWVPLWVYFAGLAVLAAVLTATPLAQYEFASSLFRGVIVSAVVEELIARSFFVKYKMSVKEFIFFNILSSLAFTYMHSFFEQGGVSLYDLLQRGHFGFSFMLGVVVYKTQRIELSMVLHMLSNLLRYTFPVCLLQCPWPSPIAIIGSMFVDIVLALALGGCASKMKKG